MTVRLPRALRYAVHFARACKNNKIEPDKLAELIALSNTAAHAGARECNVPDFSGEKQRRRVERHARELGLTTDWPGLYPSFRDDRGRTVHLPTD